MLFIRTRDLIDFGALSCLSSFSQGIFYKDAINELRISLMSTFVLVLSRTSTRIHVKYKEV